VNKIKRGQVKLGLAAPAHIQIDRVQNADQEINTEAKSED